MLMFVRYFFRYSCGIDGETFDSINIWDGLISGLTVVCTLLMVIVLWLVMESCAVVFLSR